jgi:2-polyprenyl-6-methoxyphenol hydroxylase-like FAD-dependent oxidoreductase
MKYDIIIVGAGPAGLSFARSLANTGLRIAIIEKQPEEQLAKPEFDGRDIALTHLSVRILKELGIWERFQPEDRPSIREARVLDGTSSYSLTFGGERETDDVLGYIVSNHIIRKSLYDEVALLDNVELHTDVTVTAVSTNDDVASVVLSDGRLWSRLRCQSHGARASARRNRVRMFSLRPDSRRVAASQPLFIDRRHRIDEQA